MQVPTRRKEGMQRIQIGVSGLAGVVLLVGLANIVVDNIRKDEKTAEMTVPGAAVNAAAGEAPAVKPTEPLAELGVAPASSGESAQQPVVADLRPDPNLKERMDQPPAVTPTLPAEQRAPQQR
ncbi:MAG: hypothetical protein E2598_04050 [Sphingobium sp.]|nr:hypothetical protein [Sphingobium sp.]